MSRSPRATAIVAAFTRVRACGRTTIVAALTVVAMLTVAFATLSSAGAAGGGGRSATPSSLGAGALAAGGCDRAATPSSLASEVSAASAGQTICLASGSYGTWSGTNKAITLRAADGATATMRYAFSTGDSGFTLDGLSGMGGTITDGAHDITIKNSTFTTHATFDRLAN